MKIDNLEKLFQEQLKDIYDAEKRLTKALPKMVKASQSENLKAALTDHLSVTVTQVGRLEKVFELTGTKAVAKTCLAMKGLLEEGEEALATEAPEPISDLCIVSAGRRVEHYEIAAYETLRAMAQTLQMAEAEELLNENLQEEMDADEALAELGLSLMESVGSNQNKTESARKLQPASTKVGTRRVVNA